MSFPRGRWALLSLALFGPACIEFVATHEECELLRTQCLAACEPNDLDCVIECEDDAGHCFYTAEHFDND